MTVIDTIVQQRIRQRSLISDFAAYVVRKLMLWQHLRSSRTQLSKLSDEALADIGVSREVANGEAYRPFWVTSKRPY